MARDNLVFALVDALAAGDKTTVDAIRSIMAPAEQMRAIAIALTGADPTPPASGPLVEFARTLAMED